MKKNIAVESGFWRPGLALPKNAGKISGPEGLGMWAKWEIELRRGAKVLERREGPSHSFVKNFAKLWRGIFDFRDNTNESLTENGGSSYFPRIKTNGTTSGTDPLISAAARVRFGNSAAALASAQVALQGTVLGTFGAITTSLTVEDTTKTEFKSEGQVTNSTGNPFTVEEMGLFSQVDNETGAAQDTMMLRDLTGSVVVANGLTILGRWTFTLAV